MRILYLGENWLGSSARSCSSALTRAGCTVLELDEQVFVPQWRAMSMRIVRRALRRYIAREYNRALLDYAKHFRPDLLLAFKGTLVEAATLISLKRGGILTANYYPDNSIFGHGSRLPKALPEYDCVFATKPFFADDVRRYIAVANVMYLPHGYDSELHRPLPLTDRDLEDYRHDVSYIGIYTPYKEQMIDSLLRKRPDLDLAIWGERWSRCGSLLVRQHVKGYALYGTSYSKALCAARMVLAIHSGRSGKASQGDQTSTRTFQIPACGALMLHERTPELLSLYEDGAEVVTFATIDELSAKIEYYLAHEAERSAIALRGFNRCVPQYSYDNRVETILDWSHSRLDTVPRHASQRESSQVAPL